ncbi:hypothetical protein C8F04DRAFT_140642 [Mycena alexandri]|uniref:DUF6534 domain-containing protein n=1 Tax=Mycena alexandri TaxID=1745969 RepID=A0AAD6SDH0_9AGAR|nr:hypothetical protein C8F04DRAFT_140642 [Mycena alexandri]
MSSNLPDLDATTGALLIGTWANSFLYMAELTQARYYFRHFKHDDWKLKALVLVAFLVDTISTAGDYACVYLYTVTHASDPHYLADQNWPIPLYLFTTAIIAVVVQSFLIVRYWWFSRNILVTLLNSFLCIVAFGGAVACGVIIAMFPAFKEREKVKIPATIWLVAEAVADLSIAAALLWELRKARPTLVDTRSVLDRLVALTIRTGTATATLAVATVIAFLLKEETNISVGIAYTLGRVYVLSMLANLNVRRSGRSASKTSGAVTSAGGLATLTIPSIVTDFDSNDFPNTVDVGPQQYLTLTGSCAKSLGEDSRPETAMTASHPRRKQPGLLAV